MDAAGLDAMDRRYLTTIAEHYAGGPVGVETLAAALSEPRDAIEEIIEPFLIQKGLLQRTPRGRLITSHAFKHLGLAEPTRDPSQFGLFANGDDERVKVARDAERWKADATAAAVRFPRHRRSRRRDDLQLLDLHHEGHLASDRAA